MDIGDRFFNPPIEGEEALEMVRDMDAAWGKTPKKYASKIHNISAYRAKYEGQVRARPQHQGDWAEVAYVCSQVMAILRTR